MSSPLSAVVLSRRGRERLESRHPWIYRSDTHSLPNTPGFYPVNSKRGHLLGWAAVNPQSEISVRIMHYTQEPVTESELILRVHRALDYRAELKIDADSYRLIYGEADGLPALIVDKYAAVLVIQNGSAALEPFIPTLVRLLQERFEPSGILARFDHKARKLEGLQRFTQVLLGHVPEEITCTENNITYCVDPYKGQKTGAFLDHRLNRARLGRNAFGRALDIFSYQGAFGLHLARNADSIECVDISAPALAYAKANMKLNGFVNATFTEANAFDRLRELADSAEVFDTINLDPPAFAKKARDLDNAYRAYKELNLRAMKMLSQGGILGTSSCSFHVSPEDFLAMLHDAAADAKRSFRISAKYGQAPDHPERLGFPESHYLKFVMLQALD